MERSLRKYSQAVNPDHETRTSQIEDEVSAIFDFLRHIYGLFGFTFKLELSTRPEKRLGDDAIWDKAESVRLALYSRGWLCAFCAPCADVRMTLG